MEDEGLFLDARIVGGDDGVSCRCHRMVLAAVSDTLGAAFKDQDGEESETVVVVQGLEGDEVRKCVQGIYGVMRQV